MEKAQEDRVKKELAAIVAILANETAGTGHRVWMARQKTEDLLKSITLPPGWE